MMRDLFLVRSSKELDRPRNRKFSRRTDLRILEEGEIVESES